MITIPPEMIDLAKETTRQISAWFGDNPAVRTDKEAKQIKLYIDRAKLCLKDLEDERDSKVRPLNEKVSQINAMHKSIRRPLGVVLDEMLGALDLFIRAEEEKRIKVAQEAKRKAQEAEAKAREAERLERDKIENAKLGELGVDIAAAVKDADTAFEEYEKAARAALRAEAETHVKIAGGFNRAITIREKEVLEVENAFEALNDMGLTENVRLAILTAARAFRKLKGTLPAGIRVTIERHTG